MRIFSRCALLAFFVFLSFAVKAEFATFEGIRVCIKCHDRQGDEWKKTSHAMAFESLKPKVKAAAKSKAKLDPDKDYTQDKDCLTCHSTGYGQAGGYSPSLPSAESKLLQGVGCESCHGAGSRYRVLHGDADNKLKRSAETTERKLLLPAGQTFDYEQSCAQCHLNYHGSPWPSAKAPFTPFTPAIDAKYSFDFAKAVKAPAGVHTHFKLMGVFKGEPIPKIRADMQRDAQNVDD
jgi:hypothetical protein